MLPFSGMCILREGNTRKRGEKKKECAVGGDEANAHADPAH